MAKRSGLFLSLKRVGLESGPLCFLSIDEQDSLLLPLCFPSMFPCLPCHGGMTPWN